jgi:hypothetical protein
MVSAAVQTWIITCTTKALWDGYLVITHLSGPGGTWAYGDVIAAINSGMHRFYASDGTTMAEIKVFRGTVGPYLKTVSDGRPSNNLEELPGCL